MIQFKTQAQPVTIMLFIRFRARIKVSEYTTVINQAVIGIFEIQIQNRFLGKGHQHHIKKRSQGKQCCK